MANLIDPNTASLFGYLNNPTSPPNPLLLNGCISRTPDGLCDLRSQRRCIMSQDNIADVYVPRCNNNCYMSYLCGSVRYACDADPLAQTISNCTTIAPKESLVGGRMNITQSKQSNTCAYNWKQKSYWIWIGTHWINLIPLVEKVWFSTPDKTWHMTAVALYPDSLPTAH